MITRLCHLDPHARQNPSDDTAIMILINDRRPIKILRMRNSSLSSLYRTSFVYDNDDDDDDDNIINMVQMIIIVTYYNYLVIVNFFYYYYYSMPFDNE